MAENCKWCETCARGERRVVNKNTSNLCESHRQLMALYADTVVARRNWIAFEQAMIARAFEIYRDRMESPSAADAGLSVEARGVLATD